ACNTVHCFHGVMQSAIKIPILNMIDLVSEEVKDNNLNKVLLLSSETTNKLKLYQNSLNNLRIESFSINNDDQIKINNIILNVMSGAQGIEDILIIKDIVDSFKDKKIEGIVLGCTEIPLAIKQSDIDIKLFDAVEIIARVALNIAMNN
ncbi:amino acid racemase, partial [bacterium]|nr:amino acid racemase [bacterium]